MIITQEEVVDRQTVLNIELEDEDLNPYLDQGYRKVVQRIVIPGFRKGKAPRRIVENFIGREVLLNEVLDTMLPQVTGRAIDAQEIEVGGLPDIELVEFDPLTVKATVPLTPEIDLGSYRDIRIEEETAEVTEEDVQERLEQMRGGLATWEPVERAAQMEDMATITVTGDVEGETIIDETDVPFVLMEDNPSPVPGFSEELVGMEIDTPKEFTISVPEDFGDDNIAGKEAKFSVTISDLKERDLPELDDEFAKSVGDDHETLEDLRKDVEKNLTDRAENELRQKHQQALIQALMDSSTIELPPVMVDHEVTHMENERNQTLSQLNIRPDDFFTRMGKTEEEVRDELREEAVERIKRTLVLSKLESKESIEVSDGEVEERVENLLAGHDDDEDHEGHDHTVTDEMRSSVRRMLLTEYTINKLVLIGKGEAPPLPEAEEGSSDDSEEPKEESTENTEPENSTEGGDTDDSKA